MTAPYYPTEEELVALGFYEGYGELWLCDGSKDAKALIDMDEHGTGGYIMVGERITYAYPMDSLTQIKQLVESAKAPF